MRLQINIGNNYSKENVVRKGEGIGLKNVRSRLGIVYGSNELLNLETTDDYFEVQVTFPQER